MAPTICLADHNDTSTVDTSCPRSKLKPDRVHVARRKRIGINQSTNLAASIYSPSNECSSNNIADNPNHSHSFEATLPDAQTQKPKIVYKDLQKLCDLVARTRSLALRNYILELMLKTMKRSVRSLPQSTRIKSKSKNNIEDLNKYKTEKLDIITSSMNEEDIEEQSSCSGSNETESTTD